MKRETALQIATRFYTFIQGTKPENLMVKSMEPANGKIVLRTTVFDEDEDDNVTYEIDVDPTTDAVTMKKVIVEFKASDFAQDTKRLSELKEGDLFHMEGNCTVYRFYRAEVRYGEMTYSFSRKDGRDIYWNSDTIIYPCIR